MNDPSLFLPAHLVAELQRLWRPEWAPLPLPDGITPELLDARSRRLIWRHAPLWPWRRAARYAVGWWALAGLRQIVRVSPRPPSAAVAAMAHLLRMAARRPAQMAAKNVGLAFPEASEAWRQAVLARFYPAVVRSLFDTLAMEFLDARKLAKTLPIAGIEYLETATTAGRGAIVATAHFGAFAWGFARMAHAQPQAAAATATATATPRKWPIAVIVRRQKDPVFDAYWKRLRDRFGVVSIPDLPGRTAVRIARTWLQRGGIVYLALDQRAPGNEPLVPFFGRPVHTYSMPAKLAVRTGCAIVPAFITAADGTPKLECFAPIEPTVQSAAKPAAESAAVFDTLAQFHAVLEFAIRREPWRWWWFHDRFRRYDN